MLIGGDKRSRLQFHRGSLQSALRSSGWLHWKWCQTGHLQGASRFPARPRCEDGRWLSALLTRSDLEAWKDWRRVLLRSPNELHEVIAREGRVAPHTDPELKRELQCYARLVRDVSLRGLVSFWAQSEATVGVYVVSKKLGKQRQPSGEPTLSAAMALCVAHTCILGGLTTPS